MTGLADVKRGVPAKYAHNTKEVRAGDAVRAGAAILKWYEIAPAQAAVPETRVQSARSFLACEEVRRELTLRDELGFAILHRCEADFHFLLVAVWRGANEIWQAVYFSDGGELRFRPFEAANPGPGRPLRPTFCVWELGVVHHEMAAWRKYLESGRCQSDVTEWQNNTMAGIV